jgi:hypothetical protein
MNLHDIWKHDEGSGLSETRVGQQTKRVLAHGNGGVSARDIARKTCIP